MRVLGIDPGTVCTGWGLVERAGPNVRGVDAGVLRVDRERALPERLRDIHEGLLEIVEREAPAAVAVEDIFYAKHASAALKLGHVRGVALLVAANSDIDVFAYPPAVVKRAVAGRGRADKRQIARLVGAMLGWRALPATDATDALAIAITHVQASRINPETRSQLGAGRGARRKR